MDVAELTKTAELQRDHWWFGGRRAVLRSVLDSLVLPSESHILEVGCGPGGNLPMLAEYGRVDAMEYDRPSLEYAQKRFPEVSFSECELPHNLDCRDECYDLVCAFDVLEHVPDDIAAVNALSCKLKPGGTLFCTAPANQWMWSGHDEVNHHRRRYSLRRFSGLFRQAGLEQVQATYFNTLLFPVAAAVRLCGVGSDAKGSDLDEHSPHINAVLKTVFSMEKHLVPRFRLPFGVSVLSVVRKPYRH